MAGAPVWPANEFRRRLSVRELQLFVRRLGDETKSPARSVMELYDRWNFCEEADVALCSLRSSACAFAHHAAKRRSGRTPGHSPLRGRLRSPWWARQHEVPGS